MLIRTDTVAIFAAIHSYIHRQKKAPMELAQLGNKSQKISCSFQLLSSLSVNYMKITRATVSRCTISDFYRFQIFFISLGPFCVRNHECHISSLWVLIYMVTHNHGYIKFGSTYKILETSYTFFSNFWAACGLQLFWYSKYVGIHKCG